MVTDIVIFTRTEKNSMIKGLQENSSFLLPNLFKNRFWIIWEYFEEQWESKPRIWISHSVAFTSWISQMSFIFNAFFKFTSSILINPTHSNTATFRQSFGLSLPLWIKNISIDIFNIQASNGGGLNKLSEIVGFIGSARARAVAFGQDGQLARWVTMRDSGSTIHDAFYIEILGFP